MNSSKIRLIAFILVALAQLYVPAKMIWNKEDIIATGVEFKFKTAPVDPNDPFRGKYINLNYEDITVAVANPRDWTIGESIYVLLKTDSTGFAKIKSVSKIKPTENENFIKAKVWSVYPSGHNKLTIEYPMDRFYMEESKAYDAELSYRDSQRDTSKITYALVSIKNGEAVLKEILIDGTPIKEIVEKNQQRNKE
ncbi:MAG: GDYXXLXY domain-containing protein [Bacteroidota bacterium]